MRRILAGLVLAAAMVGGCASSGDKGPAWVVVEPNAEITDRSFVRRMSVIDDDQILVEEAPSRYFLIKLFPGCISFADIMAPVTIQETGMGIDRSTRFYIDGRTCPVRSIDRVERAPPAAPAGEEKPAEGAQAPT